MASEVTKIQNVSPQILGIIHSAGATTEVGDVPRASTGTLKIVPGKSVSIESDRLDPGQLKNLENKKLIKTSRYSA